MAQNAHGKDPGPEDPFRELHERPTPEVDSQRLWERIETHLTPRAVPLWRRLLGLGGASAAAGAFGAPRLAYGLATLAILVAVWLTWTLTVGSGGSGQQVVDTPAAVEQGAEPDAAAAGAAQLVLMTPQEDQPDVGDVAIPPGPMRIRMRLVRGYDGAAPDDVRAATAMGVGGADALADVRDQLDVVARHDELGIIGTWQGEIADGQVLSADLSDAYRVAAEAVEATAESGAALRFRNVVVEGTEQPLVATNLTLVAGRPYILGVVPADGARPSVFLVIEIEAAGGQRP